MVISQSQKTAHWVHMLQCFVWLLSSNIVSWLMDFLLSPTNDPKLSFWFFWTQSEMFQFKDVSHERWRETVFLIYPVMWPTVLQAAWPRAVTMTVLYHFCAPPHSYWFLGCKVVQRVKITPSRLAADFLIAQMQGTCPFFILDLCCSLATQACQPARLRYSRHIGSIQWHLAQPNSSASEDCS